MPPLSLHISSQGSDASISSPRSCISGSNMKKSSTITKSSKPGIFPSSRAPNYWHRPGAVYQKGWSLEQVSLPVNPGRRFGSNSVFMHLGNERALPSKWEDAEKWILSPVSGDGFKNLAVPPHKSQPKSKSGPLGSSAVIGSYTAGSVLVQNSVSNSPLMDGVLEAEHGCYDGGSVGKGVNGGGRTCCAPQPDHRVVRSASVHGWLELLNSSSLPSCQDEKNGSKIGKGSSIVSAVMVKDVATQMSPDSRTGSSQKERPTSSPLSPPTSHSMTEPQNHTFEFEVKDVQVDDRVTITRWSKKHVIRGLDKDSTRWKKKTVDASTSAWETPSTVKCTPKFSREEAKITAWENLQKAKAEASIRKLEMKLEKKRASSMDKILKKLDAAQRKAQEMRGIVAVGGVHLDAPVPKWSINFCKCNHKSPFGGCFSCHAV